MGPGHLAPDDGDEGWSLWATRTWEKSETCGSLSRSWRLQLPKAHREKTYKEKQHKQLPVRGKGALTSALFLDNLTFISIWNGDSQHAGRELDMGRTVKWQNMKGGSWNPQQSWSNLYSFETSLKHRMASLPGAPWLSEKRARCVTRKSRRPTASLQAVR